MQPALATCCLVLTLISAVPGLGAQRPPDTTSAEWQRVQSIIPGTEVMVRRAGKEWVAGRFMSAAGSELVVSAKGGDVRIDRAGIDRVRARRKSSWLRGGAIWGAVGAGVGVAIVAALGGALTDGDGVSEEGAVLLGAIGGGLGFAIGAFSPSYTTVYKVR
ncbi:MAG TPA: hypothetical protein VEQ63_10470 [Bryobacteraceae bacterium]|nr:hypothetical protein [Bryobacteraceae bacterium]